MTIRFTQRGDFSNTEKFLNGVKKKDYRSILEKYGEQGVDALRLATPKDSGLTASDWRYAVEVNPRGLSISWYNENVVDGVPVAVLIQYGHGTRSGSFVQGRDYINPAMRPIFDSLAENLWKEVNNL